MPKARKKMQELQRNNRLRRCRGEKEEVGGETGEVTGDTSGKVAGELVKDVGKTGEGREAGEAVGEVGEQNKVAGELEEVGEPGKVKEAGKLAGELCKGSTAAEAEEVEACEAGWRSVRLGGGLLLNCAVRGQMC